MYITMYSTQLNLTLKRRRHGGLGGKTLNSNNDTCHFSMTFAVVSLSRGKKKCIHKIGEKPLRKLRKAGNIKK
jgi:hypothetical protein